MQRDKPARARGKPCQGPAPIIAYHDNHDRLSALPVLTVSPTRHHVELYLRFQPHNFQAIDVADFLRALVGHLRGPIMRLWDRGSMHRGSAIDAVYQAHLRLHLEEFPVYAPALNPTEQVWNDCKGHIASSRLRNTRELRWCLAASAPSRNGARSSAVPSCPRHHKGGLIAYAKPNN
jgi:transposase